MVDLKKYGFQKEEAISDSMDGTKLPSGYPEPFVRKRLVLEDQNASIENSYYWFLGMMRHSMIMPTVEKVIDSYAASEHSSMWGSAMQRASLQQQNASQYMRGVSEMLKGLFQIVREVRDLDMRLIYYDNTKKWDEDKDVADSAEITLKGLWVDLVEGGSKSPASVYGMSQQLGFTILPDLFFRVNPPGAEQDPGAIARQCDALQYNAKVREVLKRKLTQYYNWKKHSEMELRNRRKWTLKYLRQHYATIKLYTQWIRPYLRNAKNLAFSQKHQNSPDLVKTFETNLAEMEILAVKPMGKVNSVILINFLYRTKPSMDYTRDGFQHRGPTHTGEISITIRGYPWTDIDVENYKKMREEEGLELIGEYDKSVLEAIESLGDDLKGYLSEAGEKFPEKEGPKKKPKKKKLFESIPLLEPFIAVGKGFAEMLAPIVPEKSKGDGPTITSRDEWQMGKDRQKVLGHLKGAVFNMSRFYKKANGMLTW